MMMLCGLLGGWAAAGAVNSRRQKSGLNFMAIPFGRVTLTGLCDGKNRPERPSLGGLDPPPINRQNPPLPMEFERIRCTPIAPIPAASFAKPMSDKLSACRAGSIAGAIMAG